MTGGLLRPSSAGASWPSGEDSTGRMPSSAALDSLRSRTWIVIPAFNEEATISRVVEELIEDWPRVVVVDDGSSDATAERARRSGATVISHLVNRGQGAALQTGLAYCLRVGADCLVTFDADGQHRPEDIPRLLEPIAHRSSQVALGSRFLERPSQVPRARRLLLRAAVLFTRLTSGIPITDTHNGLRALAREAAARIDLKLDRMAHASELIDQIGRLGLRYREVPVRIRYTDYSRAKGQRASAAVRVLVEYVLGRLLG